MVLIFEMILTLLQEHFTPYLRPPTSVKMELQGGRDEKDFCLGLGL